MGRAGSFLNHFLFHAVIWFNRISSFFQHSESLYKARFAHIHELTELLTDRFDDTSLLLGIADFHNLLCVRPTQARSELGNLLAVATTRGGKGLLATSQLLSWPHSVIVNDIKGDLFTQTAGYRATLGKVVIISPRGYGHRHDPLFGMYTEDALLSAATALLFDPDERDKVFTQRAITMLTQLFLAARAERYPPLPYVRHMIRSPLPDVAARLNIINPDLATQFLQVHFDPASNDKTLFDNKFLVSAWETVTSRLKPLLTETVVRTLAGTDVTPQEIMCSRKPVTVYLHWPERDLLALSPLVRLVWGSLINGLIDTYDEANGVNCRPVLLLIDEAGRTAIPALADKAATVAGRNISLWLSIQSLSQLDAVYGEAQAQIIKDNIFSYLFYKPSDQKTAEYIERNLSYKSGFAHSETKYEAHSTEGTNEQRVSLLTAWEIKHMTKRTDIFGFYNSDDKLPPFRAQRMDWRLFPYLRERHAMPLPTLSPLPEFTETLPPLIPQSNGQVTGFINPDM
jgi:type IV secretion system protein VirD4